METLKEYAKLKVELDELKKRAKYIEAQMSAIETILESEVSQTKQNVITDIGSYGYFEGNGSVILPDLSDSELCTNLKGLGLESCYRMELKEIVSKTEIARLFRAGENEAVKKLESIGIRFEVLKKFAVKV